MPRAVLFIPLYMLVTAIGINNSIYGLMLIYPTITIPYATWMLISYFRSIPDEIEEAAMIDGCSRIRTMTKIIFPLSAPGIAATFIFHSRYAGANICTLWSLLLKAQTRRSRWDCRI